MPGCEKAGGSGSFHMTRNTKIVVFVLGGTGVVIVVGIVLVAALFLFYPVDKEVLRNVAEKKAEGHALGQKTDQEGCMTEALARSKNMTIVNIDMCSANQTFTTECLKSSSPAPGFCDGVPGRMAAGLANWSEKQCDLAGLNVRLTGCTAVFDMKVNFCNP